MDFLKDVTNIEAFLESELGKYLLSQISNLTIREKSAIEARWAWRAIPVWFNQKKNSDKIEKLLITTLLIANVRFDNADSYWQEFGKTFEESLDTHEGKIEGGDDERVARLRAARSAAYAAGFYEFRGGNWDENLVNSCFFAIKSLAHMVYNRTNDSGYEIFDVFKLVIRDDIYLVKSSVDRLKRSPLWGDGKRLVFVKRWREMLAIDDNVGINNYVPWSTLAELVRLVDKGKLSFSQEIFWLSKLKSNKKISEIVRDIRRSAYHTTRIDSKAGAVADTEAENLTPTAERYVDALYALIVSEQTNIPLTISIEAAWGNGKSSVMRGLQRKLEDADHASVWFNPWTHEAGKTMWAAFALSFEQQLGRRLSWWSRVLRKLKLGAIRISLTGRITLSLKLLVGVAVFCISLWLYGKAGDIQPPTNGVEEKRILTNILLKGAPWMVGLYFLWNTVYEISKRLNVPLGVEFMGRLFHNRQGELVDDLYRFHEDFVKLLKVYAPGSPTYYFLQRLKLRLACFLGDNLFFENLKDFRNCCRRCRWLPQMIKPYNLGRVVVFIDDLDRCEAGKAADVLQSVHQMLSRVEQDVCVERQKQRAKEDDQSRGKIPGIICILGIDREKVAASVAAKHEKLMPFLQLADDRGSKTETLKEKASALDFGHVYLEKFIQLTVQIPVMPPADLDAYLMSLANWDGVEKTRQSITETTLTVDSSGSGANRMDASMFGESEGSPRTTEAENSLITIEEAEREENLKKLEQKIADGQVIFKQAKRVAPALDHNPRKLKQFVNAFRFQLYLFTVFDRLDHESVFDDSEVRSSNKLSVKDVATLIALHLARPRQVQTMRELLCRGEAYEVNKASWEFSTAVSGLVDELFGLSEGGEIQTDVLKLYFQVST